MDYYKKISEEFDLTNFKKMSIQISNYESSFCYKDFRKSAFYCREKLRDAGSKVDIVTLPADGNIVFLDHINPEAFDVEEAHLEIIEPVNRVLADLKDESFCVANRCGRTPEEGVFSEVIEKERMDKGENIEGKVGVIQGSAP